MTGRYSSYRPTSVITMRGLTLLLLCFSLSFLLLSCARQPITRLTPENTPLFTDHTGRSALLTAAMHHLSFLEKLPENHVIQIDGLTISKKRVVESARLFVDIVQSTPEPLEFNNEIRQRFTVYQASGRTNDWRGNLLATGYYEPVLPGSLEKKPPFIHPLYGVPRQLLTRTPEQSAQSDKREVGRIDVNGHFTGFWSRSEIEEENHLLGQEIVYLKDPFDAFLLHVQGSGKIQLPDGSIRSLRFAGHNGHEYKSIGKLLVDEGILDLKSVSVPALRSYLLDNPEETTRVLHHNPRYIFFSWGDDSPPQGSTGATLTAGRSVAIDRDILPEELICYLVTQSPQVDKDESILGWEEFRRFVMPQDSGAAIKGPGRVDLFYGSDTYSKIAAGVMKHKARLYFLLAKE